MMKLALFSLIAGSAAAFAPAGSTARTSVAVKGAMEDLKSVAEKSNPVLKYYDPMELAKTSIWGQSNEATIGYLRHSEIKHGRIAMAAFVGYIVGANGLTFPWPSVGGGVTIPSGLSPPEQWDAMPEAAKWQIILFIGFLEWWSESNGQHYMRGGVPGKFPEFGDKIPHPMPFKSLYDPFGFHKNKSAEAKERGLISELNNGRLAQIGIIGFLCEQKIEGSVPLLKGLVSHYDGEVMAPFMY